ncbi:MAG: septum formation initiator family protein [Myxococcota bacterium]|nr:septum formation initiator family protein [Myxococcota bacterium]
MKPPASLNSTLVRRLLLGAVPFTLMGAVVLMTIFGDHGLVRRHELRQEKRAVDARTQQLQRENLALKREIQILEQEPIGARRLAAQELLVAQPGSTIYRFEESE